MSDPVALFARGVGTGVAVAAPIGADALVSIQVPLRLVGGVVPVYLGVLALVLALR